MNIDAEKLPAVVGAKMRTLRLQRGVSQEKLAIESGLDRTYISGIERGTRNPSIKNLGHIANALNIDITELFTLV